MNTKAIGEIIKINRYPVKSLAGEQLNRVNVQPYGLLGDRSHAFIDPTKEGWDRYVTARQIPELLSYKANLDAESTDDGLPLVKITGPDGRIYQWDDQFLAEIQKLSNRPILAERFSLDSEEQLAVDDGSILIITDRSLKRMEQLWNKHLDERRFRANFVLKLYDGVNDYEPDYLGKQISIGNVELAIQSLCKRCSMVTIDPDNLERDSSLLRNIHDNMNLCFGMYANVVRVGTVRVGDLVYAEETLNVSELWYEN